MEFGTFSAFLDFKKLEYIERNDIEAIKNARRREKNLVAKVSKFINEKLTEEEKKKISTNYILEKIETDFLIRAFFRKDYTQQSIHEVCQIEWLRNKYPDIIKLPTSKGGYYFHKYNLTNHSPKYKDSTKTLDFHVPSCHIYGVLKYSTTNRAAQDNQYEDVKNFLRQMIGYLENNANCVEIFEFYLDGDFYEEKKIKNLEDMVPSELKVKISINSVTKLTY